MNQWLSGVNRAQLIRWTAIYLLVYAVVNACGGIVFGIAGGLAAGVGAMSASLGEVSSDAGAATTALVGIGGLSLGLAILYLISVPVFGIAAWGLFQRKRWARLGAVIALGLSVLMSLLTIGNSFTNIFWVAISVVGIYLFWTDAGIKAELKN